MAQSATSPAAIRQTEKNLLHDSDFETAAGFRWEPIIIFYCIYILIILAGGFIEKHTATWGGLIFLLLLYGRYWHHLLNMKIDMLVLFVFLSMLVPLIPMISYDEGTFAATYNELIKYYALNMVILLGVSLHLTPIGRSGHSWILHFTLLSFLVAGWVFSRLHGNADPRVTGFLPNPNGFALTAMMLLFLTDERGKNSPLALINHAIVITLIYVSRTSGALIGYLTGTFHRFVFGGRGRHRAAKGIALLLVFTACTAVFLVIPENTFKPVDATLQKIDVTRRHLDRVMSEKKIDFYSIIEEKNGEDVTSGLWRIYQWNNIIRRLMNSPIEKILFGYGIGTTEVVFKAKSHNDYLRILFETGVIGFIFNITIWVTLYRRMDAVYRWIPVMVAVFCITENNYDHFPAMSMLVFYMIGSGMKPSEIRFTRTAINNTFSNLRKPS